MGAGNLTDLASKYDFNVCITPEEAEEIQCAPSTFLREPLSRRVLWHSMDLGLGYGQGSASFSVAGREPRHE